MLERVELSENIYFLSEFSEMFVVLFERNSLKISVLFGIYSEKCV